MFDAYYNGRKELRDRMKNKNNKKLIDMTIDIMRNKK